MEIKTVTVDALTTEIRWKQDGKVRREQFCGRSPDEVRKQVEERLDELRREI